MFVSKGIYRRLVVAAAGVSNVNTAAAILEFGSSSKDRECGCRSRELTQLLTYNYNHRCLN